MRLNSMTCPVFQNTSAFSGSRPTIIVDYRVMSDQAKKMDQIVPDLPRGPLDVYRQRASFNWKEMVLFLEGEDNLEFKVATSNDRAPLGHSNINKAPTGVVKENYSRDVDLWFTCDVRRRTCPFYCW